MMGPQTRQMVCGAMLLVCFLLPDSARGQDNTIDLFDELESIEVTAPGDSLSESIGSQIVSNFSGKLSMRWQHFREEPVTILNRDVYDNPNLFESRLNMSTWFGRDGWRLSASGWFEGGNEKNIWRGFSDFAGFLQNKDHYRRYIELNELYFRSYHDRFDLTVGKMIFTNGICPLFSPADRYGPSDFNDPIESRELGSWIGQADVYLGNTTLTGVIFPFYQSSRIPSERSRWMSAIEYGNDPDQNRIPIMMRAGTPGKTLPPITAENAGYLLRLKTTYSGWDLFASGYYGLNSQDVYRGDEITVKIPSPDVWAFADAKTYDFAGDVVKVSNSAAGFSTTYKKMEFHGEGVYNHSFGSKDDNFISYLAGFSYNVGDFVRILKLNSITLYVDYAGEEVTKKQSADGYIISSRNSRFGGKDFIIGENDLVTYLSVGVTADLNVHVISLKQLSHDGMFNRIIGSYRFNDSITCSLALDLFSGSMDNFIGRWDTNDRATLLIDYHL